MTFISRLLGFARDVVVAQVFGANAATDAFFVAFKIPNFLRRLFAEGAFSQAFVPVLSDYKTHYDRDGIRQFLDRTAGTLAIILMLTTLIGMMAAPAIIFMFAPGFYTQGDAYQLSVEMLRITFPYLFFISMTAFAGGILNTWGYFAIPALTPVLLNIAMIAAALWLTPYMGVPIEALAWGVFFAGALQLLFQFPVLIRSGLMPRLRCGFHDPGVRRIMQLMVPAIFGVSVTQVNLLIDTLIASFLVTGSVSWLYYSDRLVEFPLGIFGVAIGTVILPHLSRNHSSNNSSGFSHSLDWALRWVILIAIPATVGLVLLAQPLISTLFQRDHFSSHDVVMASRSLMTYSTGLLAFIAIKVLVPGFSSRKDLKTPVRCGMYAMLANVIFNLALIFPLAPLGWGHAGLALATAMAAWVNCILLFTRLRRDRIYQPRKGWLFFLLRSLLANGAMGALLWYAATSYPWGDWTLTERITSLALWITLGMLTYASSLWLLGLRPRHLLLHEET
ncbi:MAG: hypothetical protein RIQ52_1810 [Pseudomonadota bacterium]|jgi:putative peptidoglycan lipid II flippase